MNKAPGIPRGFIHLYFMDVAASVDAAALANPADAVAAAEALYGGIRSGAGDNACDVF
jgi:hypothetical protein